MWNIRKAKSLPGTQYEDPWMGPYEVVQARINIFYIRKGRNKLRIKRKHLKLWSKDSKQKKRGDKLKPNLLDSKYVNNAERNTTNF